LVAFRRTADSGLSWRPSYCTTVSSRSYTLVYLCLYSITQEGFCISVVTKFDLLLPAIVALEYIYGRFRVVGLFKIAHGFVY